MSGQEIFEKLQNMTEEERRGVCCLVFGLGDVNAMLTIMNFNDDEAKKAKALTDDDKTNILHDAWCDTDFEGVEEEMCANIREKITEAIES